MVAIKNAGRIDQYHELSKDIANGKGKLTQCVW